MNRIIEDEDEESIRQRKIDEALEVKSLRRIIDAYLKAKLLASPKTFKSPSMAAPPVITDGSFKSPSMAAPPVITDGSAYHLTQNETPALSHVAQGDEEQTQPHGESFTLTREEYQKLVSMLPQDKPSSPNSSVSTPFKTTETKNLRCLSSKQALFDLAVFREHYQESLNQKLNRTGVENPWFVFGVSYSGALSVWFRVKFPHLTCGSLASSAVVLAVYNFTEFDQQIGESAGPECKAVLQETTHLVEERLTSNKIAAKTLFEAAELKIDGDFLADAAVIAFQYGNPDKLCVSLVKAKKDGDDLVEAYAKYVKEYYVGSFGVDVQTYNQDHLKIDSPNSSVNTLIRNNTSGKILSSYTHKPAGKRAIGCKWVFKLKHNVDGSIARHSPQIELSGFQT